MHQNPGRGTSDKRCPMRPVLHTRRVWLIGWPLEKLVESLSIARLSRSQVSVMAADLDAQAADFGTRPLDAGPYTFAAADALVPKGRRGRPRGERACPARGRGQRRRAPADPGPAGHLRRGRHRVTGLLPGPDRPRPDRRALVTSDAHRGLVEAVGATLPGATWQRCRTPYAANLTPTTPKASWPWVKTLLHSVYDQPGAASAPAQYDRLAGAVT